MNGRRRVKARGTARLRGPGCALALGLALLALPAHGLRCAGGLVDVGDHVVVVRERCGAPAWVDVRRAHPYVIDTAPAPDAAGPGASPRRIVRYLPHALDIEEWVYDLGSRRFLQLLRFHDGRLVEIETLAKPR
jgi:hypothetical protein